MSKGCHGRRSRRKLPNEELLRRREAVSQTMDKHKAIADPNDAQRRCPVCCKYTNGYEFTTTHLSSALWPVITLFAVLMRQS